MGWIVPTLTAASLASRIFRKRGKKPNVGKINAKFMGMRPGGYLTPEDVQQAERLRASGTRSAERSGQLTRIALQRSLRARGVGGAAAAALETTVGDQVASGRERAFERSADYEHGRFVDNLGFERQKLFTAWGGELGAANREIAQREASDAEFWNSMLDAIPVLYQGQDALAARAAASGGSRALVTPGLSRPSYRPEALPD